MGKEKGDRAFQHDIRAFLCDIGSRLDDIIELLEMIRDQNVTQLTEDSEDIPDGLKAIFCAREARTDNVHCIDHGDGCALCGDMSCSQRVREYKGVT